MFQRILLTMTVVGLVTPAVAHAADGVLLVQSVTSGTSPAITSQIQLEANRMRTEMDVDGRRQIIVFDGAKGLLHIIDPARKSYIEMTKADAERMGGMMQSAMAMMKEQMAKMPPAQRAQMEQKMAGLMGGAAAAGPPPVYQRNGTDTVAKRACDKYDVLTSGKKTGELCTVAPTALGLAASDFAVLSQLTEFMRAIVPQMADRFPVVGTAAQGFSGFPIRMTNTMPDGTSMTMQVTDARRTKFDDASYAVPAGFQKQAMLPSMGQ